MSLLIKNWSEADWKELLKWAKIGLNNAMIGEFSEVEEIPPHGRLIDKDALEADISASVVFSGRDGNAEIVGAKKIINRLHLAPTIIEAEEEP